MNVTQQWNEFLDEVEAIVQAMVNPNSCSYLFDLRDRVPISEDVLAWAKDYVMFNTWALKYIDRLQAMDRITEAQLLIIMMESFISASATLERESLPLTEFTKTTPF